MAKQLYLAGVGIADVFTQDGMRILTAKTLQNSSFARTVQEAVQRGGPGNGKLISYFHDPEDKLTMTDAQLNMEFIAMQAGQNINVGGVVPVKEKVTFANGVGTLKKSPMPAPGLSVAYGYATFNENTDAEAQEDVALTVGNKEIKLTDTTYNGTACVEYSAFSDTAEWFEIPAELLPSIVRVVITVNLTGKGGGSKGQDSSVVGRLILTLPNVQMNPAFTLSMSADGFANTPLEGTCLASDDAVSECDESGGSGNRVGYFTKEVFGGKWYDRIDRLIVDMVENGELVVPDGETETLVVRGYSQNKKYVCSPDYADLVFAADTGGDVTVTEDGVVTGGATGGDVTVTVADKPSLTVTVKVVPA